MRSFPEVFCNCLILMYALHLHSPSTVDELSGVTLRHVCVDGVSVDRSLHAIVQGQIQRCRVIAQWHCKLSSTSPGRTVWNSMRDAPWWNWKSPTLVTDQFRRDWRNMTRLRLCASRTVIMVMILKVPDPLGLSGRQNAYMIFYSLQRSVDSETI